MKHCTQIFGLIISIVFVHTLAKGQQQVDYLNELKMPTGVPSSPEVMAIEKFGNFPVNYSTGLPDISIPIYTIKCGNLSWPISLSYHAGGIKVDENASMAGLGWSLLGQGVISRTVVGKPDEYAIEPNYNTVSDANYEYLYLVKNGGGDSQFDIFNFNFIGKSGKFIIQQDGKVMQIPTSDLKIAYTSGFGSFTITDENGTVYSFNNKELTTSTTGSGLGPNSDLYPSSWYLSRVDLPDKKNFLTCPL